jgi:hypothetical protein
LIKNKPVYKYSGIVATLMLIFFPLFFFIRGSTMPLSFDYLFLLSLPAVVLLVFLLFMWKKF